jgi:plasmid replication initiation protein
VTLIRINIVKKKEIYESKTQKVYKSPRLNQSNFGDFTHTDYQVYLMLLSKLGGVDKNGKYLQSEELQREHTLSAKEFGGIFKTDLSNSYKILRRAVNKLMKTDITVPRENSNSYLRINVCSQAEYVKDEGKINIKFTDDIMPYLKQVKERFMVYNLADISSFKSIYTTRLFELLQEFKETGWMIKSLEELRHSFAVGNQYPKYANFKARTIVPACEEINKNYHMKMRFEEIKEGKSVTAIKFIFKPVIVLKSTNETTGETKKRFIKHEKKSVDITPETKTKSTSKQLKTTPKKEKKRAGFFSSVINFFRKK